MRSLKNIIVEKLKLSSDSKVKEKINQSNKGSRDLSSINKMRIKRLIWGMKYNDFKTNAQKIKYYYDKGSNPKRLAKDIKTFNKLFIRFIYAIILEWEECYDTFRSEMINNYSSMCSADELDGIIYAIYKNDLSLPYYPGNFNNSSYDEIHKACEKYLDKYDIKY